MWPFDSEINTDKNSRFSSLSVPVQQINYSLSGCAARHLLWVHGRLLCVQPGMAKWILNCSVFHHHFNPNWLWRFLKKIRIVWCFRGVSRFWRHGLPDSGSFLRSCAASPVLPGRGETLYLQHLGQSHLTSDNHAPLIVLKQIPCCIELLFLKWEH